MDKQILTNISKSYIPDWGVNEGVREMMQNGLDAHDRGHKMVINYLKKDQKLIISNEN